jgi:LytS/YehU family sensor histidine kinase
MAESQDTDPFTSQQFEDTLIYFSESIHSKLNEYEILWDLAHNFKVILGFADCTIYEVDMVNERLIQKVTFGSGIPKNKNIHKPIYVRFGEGIAGRVAVNGNAKIVNHNTSDEPESMKIENRLSEICIPIKIKNKVLAVIEGGHSEINYFTDQLLRLLLAVASICAIKIQSIRTEKKMKTESEKFLLIRKEMVELKLKAFRSQMNPHFIFNALNAIQFFITSENKKSALIYLSVFSRLIRFYLKHIEKETVNLNDELEMLNGYLKLQKLRYNDQFDYKISLNEKSKEIETVIPSFVLQTLFENIIEHAIYNQYKNYSIGIEFKPSQTILLVIIKFQYDTNSTSKIKYTPDYRENLMKWQDQIRLLNNYKNYQIEKNVTFNKHPAINGGNILLSLPNLS